jgi:hypothetical protein
MSGDKSDKIAVIRDKPNPPKLPKPPPVRYVKDEKPRPKR